MRGRISKAGTIASGAGLPYRPEIDGLRAVAVAAVVLYHAGVGGAGYVGVDIFFVISGYLITSLLLREIEATGGIDLASFYARRARRILPAACVVIVAVCFVSGILLGPRQSVAVDRSAAAALVFLANFHFQAATGGYFDASAAEMPLLHLWSLSVEEQYYLVWPLLLGLLAKRGRRAVVAGSAALGLVSLCLANFWLVTNSELAFFQMPPRLWELAAGALVAAWLPAAAPAKWTFVTGAILLVSSLVMKTPWFPGIGALPAVAGAALVIAYVHQGGRNVLLSSRPVVGLGLVSYSLYLWHWPLIALNEAMTLGEPRGQTIAILCGVSLLLAIATYRYVESPIRRLRTAPVATTGLSAALLIAGSAGAHFIAGMPERSDPFPLATSAEGDVPDRRCHSMGLEPVVEKCVPSPPTRWAVWGDSMAYAWMPAVRRMDHRAAVYTRDACGPYLGYLPATPSKEEKACQDFVGLALRRLEGLRSSNVVLVALWVGDEAKFKGLEMSLARVARSAGRVVIVGPTPQLQEKVPLCIRARREQDCAISRKQFDAHAKPLLRRLREAASPYANVVVLDLTDDFCTNTQCGPLKDGVPLYWDTHHVTASKAQSVDLAARAAASK